MRSSFKAITLTLAALLLLVSTAQPGTASSVGAVELQGAAYFSPGLRLTPWPQTFAVEAYTFLFLRVPPVWRGTIRANGTDLDGTVMEGIGFVNLTSPASCSGVFVRVGNVWMWDFADASVCAGHCDFVMIPTGIGLPPELGGSDVETYYTLEGACSSAWAP